MMNPIELLHLGQSPTKHSLVVAGAGCLIVLVLGRFILFCLSGASNKSLLINPLQHARDLVQSWRFVFNGRQMLLDQYSKNPGVPFSVPIPGNRLHLISSDAHWNEVNNAHASELSLHLAAKDALQPKYSMDGYEWPDRRDTEGVVFVRSLRVANHCLPQFIPKYQGIIKEVMNTMLEKAPVIKDAKKINIGTWLEETIMKINLTFVFGEGFADEPETVQSAIEYSKSGLATAEVVRVLPKVFAPLVPTLVRGRDKARQHLCKRLAERITELRQSKKAREEQESSGSSTSTTCVLEALVKLCPDEWTVPRTIDEIITVWITLMVPLSIILNKTIQDLQRYPEHIPALQKEIQDHCDQAGHFTHIEDLGLLECFLKESSRLHCFESGVCRRISLKPFTFSGGYTVPAGEWLVYLQQSTFMDESLYPDPAKFDPLRFTRSGQSPEWTEVSRKWSFWGSSKLACPGRYHATTVAKLILAHLLHNFNFDLERAKGSHEFIWRTASLPDFSIDLMLRPRSPDVLL